MSQIIASTAFRASTSNWTKHDTIWMLGLYGTAIGAGTLFLPINASVGGLWPLIVMAILALPLTFFAHRGMTRFVLSSNKEGADLTEVAEEHFGAAIGKLITLLYFFAIYPILLVYSVAITNTMLSFLNNQLHISVGTGIVARAIFSLVLILALMSVVRLGGPTIVKTISILVYPFVCALMLLAFYLIPQWNGALIQQTTSLTDTLVSSDFYKTLWLAIPVMVFSFNHSPIVSSFAIDQRELHGDDVESVACRVLFHAHVMMVFSVMFFVFSCAFSLSPLDLVAARTQNISILSYLANHFQNPVIEWTAPVIAFIAISKSFLGHYLGAKEGFNGLVTKQLRQKGKQIDAAKLDRLATLFMIITCWVVATFDPSILGMIESLGGPVIAMLLFLMPMYAIKRVPSMQKFAGAPSSIFVVVIGLVAISAIFYDLFA